MFTNIAWATDGSADADRARKYACRLAEYAHADLHMIQVVEKLEAGRVAGQNAYLDEEDREAKIGRQATETIASGVPTTLHRVHSGMSHVADKIAETARDADAELIVVGTRGHSALGGVVLGSVTQRLLHVAACPVLAVPPARDRDAGAGAHARSWPTPAELRR